MNSVHRAAREYASLGLRVFPLRPRSKVPAISRWNVRATSDPARVDGFFARRPDLNLGVMTGGGIFAVDVDDGEQGAESLKKLIRGRRFPRTATAETGGGYHYLFRSKSRIPSRVGVGPSLDVRGEGGYVVAAPSVHPETGREYGWIVHPAEVIAEAPEWLVRGLAGRRPVREEPVRPPSSGRSGDVEALTTEVVEKFPVGGFGRRNSQMVKAACSLMSRGYSRATAAEVLEGWWRFYFDMGTIATDPSEAPKSVSSTLRSIEKSGSLRAADQDAHRRGTREFTPSPHTPLIYNTSRVTVQPRELDRIFAEALAVRLAYARSLAPSGPLKATFKQVCEVAQDRHGRTLNPNEVERLKRKYVTRPGKPASVCELVRQVSTGKPGVPSEFEPTGLRGLFAGVVL